MKKLTFLLAFMIPIFLSAQTYIFSGPVSGTWDLDGSPYLVNGDIYIDKTSSLDIEAGVKVVFTEWFQFTVYGELNAIGTEESKILFTTNHPKVNWRGIRFIQPHVGSVIDHCIIEKGKADLDENSYPDNCGGALYFFRTYDQNILVQNTLIHNNQAVYGGGVYCTESSPTFENCEIIMNLAKTGGGMFLLGGSNIILKSSLIARNRAESGGGIKILRSAPQLISNSFENNLADVSGGALLIEDSDEYTIRKNQFAYNTAEMGGAIHLLNSSGSYCNNTLTFNQAYEKGGALYFEGDSDPEIMNTILFFNNVFVKGDGISVYLASKGSDPDFLYCDIEGGLIGFKGVGAGLNYSGQYEGCLSEDPLFKDIANGDFSVTWDNYPYVDDSKSPCIDAGCPNSIGDPDCTCCDIGAYYFFQLLEVPKALPPAAQNELAFLATWTEAYGALGYYLDVAMDPDFSNFILEKQDVGNVTHYPVKISTQAPHYYRLKSYNSTLVSKYSNTTVVLMVSVEEQEDHNISIYSANQEVCIRIEDQLKTSGELKVYSLSGQLITEQRINSGLTRISIDGPDQIVIVNMLLDGKAYQEKLVLR